MEEENKLGPLPVWGPKITSALNQVQDNDWRLVAQRMGYSPSDVRQWASTENASEAMLKDFFTTNDQEEATEFLKGILFEIEREDIVDLIEGREERPRTYTKRRTSDPAVFFSYQWDDRVKIQALARHLENEGINCWLDLGQTTDIQVLQEAINQGIRSSKTIVVCLNEKYTQSDNCVNECLLAETLGKALIPICMEAIAYPPSGRLNHVLTGLPCLQFYLGVHDDPERESSAGDQTWPTRSFHALLRKLRQYGAGTVPARTVEPTGTRKPPDKNVIAALPAPETDANGILDKDRTHMVISCSPDKLFEVRNMQKNLKDNGYNCKIVKLNSGSLAEEQCDVILSVLSLRYVQSPLAGREVSNAIRNGKPMIPLLLDSVTYPPNGEMKQPLSRLEPVDCTRMRSRSTWAGEEFEEILDRLESLIADVRPIRLPRREKSNIPKAKDHVQSLSQPIPMDPLAREASEIKIQIRPPTPPNDGASWIPVSHNRIRSHSTQHNQVDDEQQEDDDHDDEQDDQEQDQDDNPQVNSDSERRTAKQLQQTRKLPQLDQRKPKQSYQNNGHARNSHASNESKRSTSQQHKPKKPNYYNADGPKLPSVYRQRISKY